MYVCRLFYISAVFFVAIGSLQTQPLMPREVTTLFYKKEPILNSLMIILHRDISFVCMYVYVQCRLLHIGRLLLHNQMLYRLAMQ
jgi:hypothetical protein